MTDVQDIFKLHLEGSARLAELLAECEKLTAAGKKREAAKVLRQAEELRAQLEALEAAVSEGSKLNPGGRQ